MRRTQAADSIGVVPFWRIGLEIAFANPARDGMGSEGSLRSTKSLYFRNFSEWHNGWFKTRQSNYHAATLERCCRWIFADGQIRKTIQSIAKTRIFPSGERVAIGWTNDVGTIGTEFAISRVVKTGYFQGVF